MWPVLLGARGTVRVLDAASEPEGIKWRLDLTSRLLSKHTGHMICSSIMRTQHNPMSSVSPLWLGSFFPQLLPNFLVLSLCASYPVTLAPAGLRSGNSPLRLLLYLACMGYIVSK